MHATACLPRCMYSTFSSFFVHAQVISLEMVRMRKEMEQEFTEKLSKVYDEVSARKTKRFCARQKAANVTTVYHSVTARVAGKNNPFGVRFAEAELALHSTPEAAPGLKRRAERHVCSPRPSLNPWPTQRSSI